MGLCISRYSGESFWIGDEIRVLVYKLDRDVSGKRRAKIVIDAPREIPILREELMDRKSEDA